MTEIKNFSLQELDLNSIRISLDQNHRVRVILKFEIEVKNVKEVDDLTDCYNTIMSHIAVFADELTGEISHFRSESREETSE